MLQGRKKNNNASRDWKYGVKKKIYEITLFWKCDLMSPFHFSLFPQKLFHLKINLKKKLFEHCHLKKSSWLALHLNKIAWTSGGKMLVMGLGDALRCTIILLVMISYVDLMSSMNLKVWISCFPFPFFIFHKSSFALLFFFFFLFFPSFLKITIRQYSRLIGYPLYISKKIAFNKRWREMINHDMSLGCELRWGGAVFAQLGPPLNLASKI